nr:MAG TPA: major capsid protein [Caudoviricetes sp.]
MSKTMTIHERLEEARAKGADILAAVDRGEDVDVAELKAAGDEVTRLETLATEAEAARSMFKSMGTAREAVKSAEVETPAPAGSLGEQVAAAFMKSGTLSALGAQVQHTRGEFYSSKAPGDPTTTTNAVTGNGLTVALTDVDKNVVKPYALPFSISSWLSSGTLSGNSLTYFVANEWTSSSGRPGVVGENGKKPGATAPAFETKTLPLRKIAGWVAQSDEMAEDAGFLSSLINEQLLDELKKAEEEQIVSGTGTGNDLTGILSTPGIFSEAVATTAAKDVLESMYKVKTKIEAASGMSVDAVIVNPEDIAGIRLATDSNGQYLFGGPAYAPYGNGPFVADLNAFGVPIYVSKAVPPKTVLVGSSKGATVYRKGGVRVEVSNNVNDDFLYNRFRVLAEERLLLAVKQPKAFGKLTLK